MTVEELRRKMRRHIALGFFFLFMIGAITTHNLFSWWHRHDSWTLFLLGINGVCLGASIVAVGVSIRSFRRLKRL